MVRSLSLPCVALAALFFVLGCAQDEEDKGEPQAAPTPAYVVTSPVMPVYTGESAPLTWELKNGDPIQSFTADHDFYNYPDNYQLADAGRADVPDPAVPSAFYIAPALLSTLSLHHGVAGEGKTSSATYNTTAPVVVMPRTFPFTSGFTGPVAGVVLKKEELAYPIGYPVADVFALPSGGVATVQPNLDALTRFEQSAVRSLCICPGATCTNGFPNEATFAGLTNLSNNLAVRFTASINVATLGSYHFRLKADDGALLKIDGVTILNPKGVAYSTNTDTPSTSPIALTAGKHVLQLEYYVYTGNKAYCIQWAKPSAMTTFVDFQPAEWGL